MCDLSLQTAVFKVNKNLTDDYCHLNGNLLLSSKGIVCTADYESYNRMSLHFSQSQITVNGNSGGAVSPMSYYQRPFSPSAYSLPGSFNSSIIMQHGRSLGKSFDSHGFHDNVNIPNTNDIKKFKASKQFFKKEEETVNTLLFNDPILRESQGLHGFNTEENRPSRYSKSLTTALPR